MLLFLLHFMKIAFQINDSSKSVLLVTKHNKLKQYNLTCKNILSGRQISVQYFPLCPPVFRQKSTHMTVSRSAWLVTKEEEQPMTKRQCQ